MNDIILLVCILFFRLIRSMMSDFLVVDIVNYLIVCTDTQEEVQDGKVALLRLLSFTKSKAYEIDNNLVVDGYLSCLIPWGSLVLKNVLGRLLPVTLVGFRRTNTTLVRVIDTLPRAIVLILNQSVQSTAYIAQMLADFIIKMLE